MRHEKDGKIEKKERHKKEIYAFKPRLNSKLIIPNVMHN